MDYSAKKKISSFLKREWKSLLILIVIVFLGNNLREFSYAQVPNPGETRDEYSFGWLGLSLIKDKFPIAWSGISAYPENEMKKINVDHIYDSNSNTEPFPINSPWFDHPPAFGLFIGGYAYLKGVRTFEEASVIILRRPMLKIGIINTVLVFFLSYLLFGNKIALLSALLYSVIPTTVISSRLALAENGYLPLFLSSLIFTVVFFRSKKYIYWILASAIAGAAILFKLSAVSLFITLVLLSLSFGGKDKFKQLKTLLFYLSLFSGFYLLYGSYFGW